ncbi:hypothetical protein INR49_018021 [Caranx melampygus]|nr:hypothetical protein INR49_018021 [Caranx melampygus]
METMVMAIDQIFIHYLTSCVRENEPAKEFTLPASATKTSISDLTPNVDYSVTISAYAGSEESLPITGQITLKRFPDPADQELPGAFKITNDGPQEN